MRTSRTRHNGRFGTAALAVALATTLVACGTDDPPMDSEESEQVEPDDEPSTPEPEVEDDIDTAPDDADDTDHSDPDASPVDYHTSIDGSIGTYPATVHVPTLVRDSSRTYLRLDVENPSETESITVGDWWRRGGSLNLGPTGLRLMDLNEDLVWENITADNNLYTVGPGERVSVFAAFGQVDADQVDVVIPGMPLARDIPVEDGSYADDDALFDYVEGASGDPDLADPVHLDTYTQSFDDSIDSHTTEDEVVVNLGSDVLFGVEEYELSDEADETLETVADQLDAYEGGTMTIIGHTDENPGSIDNQELSELRAAAVEERLEELTDLSSFDIALEGRGSSQPRIDESNEDAWAANRRVEIVVEPNVDAPNTMTPDDAEAPPAEGIETSDASQVTIDRGDGSIDISVTAERVGEWIIGEFDVIGGDVGSGGPIAEYFQSGRSLVHNQRGALNPSQILAATSVSLLGDGMRYYVADYVPAGSSATLPMADTEVRMTLAQGRSTTVVMVWPDPGGDTITVDLEADDAGTQVPFRITDIHVEDRS